jgi:BMFP domain-containing protein YqiC
MDNNSRILDDLTRVAGGAFNILSTIGKQVQGNLKDQMGDKFSSSPANDDVTRLQGTISKLRIEQEELKKRVAELEALVGKKPAKKAVKKSAPLPKTKTKAKAKKRV